MKLRNPRPRKADCVVLSLESRVLLAATVTGSVYNDANLNGTKDAGETGLVNWTVFLDANFNNRLDSGETTTTTDSSGNYSFASVAAGTTHLAIGGQTNWEETSPSPGRLVVMQKVNSVSTTFPTAQEVDPLTGLFLHNDNVDQISSSNSVGSCIGPGVYYNIVPINSSTSQITAYDLNSGVALAGKTFTISTTFGCNGAAYLNGKVYISTISTGSGEILVWDPSTQQLTASFGITGTHLTGGFAGCADDGFLYSTDNNGVHSLIDVIDPSTKTLVRQLAVAVPIANGLAYVNGELLAPNAINANQIYRIDPATGTVIGSMILQNDPVHTGNITALAGDGSAQRTVIVPATGSVAAGTFGVSTISAAPTGISFISTGTYRVYGTVTGATVNLYNSANTIVLTKTATGSTTDFTITPISGATLTANQSEPSKIASGLSPTYYTNMATNEVATDLANASDTGLSQYDNITTVTTPTFVGAADNGTTVRILNGGTLIGSGTAANGAYSITTSALFASNTNQIYATTSSTGGAVVSTLNVTVDTTPPSIFTTGTSVDVPNVSVDFNTPAPLLVLTGDAVTVKNLSTNVSTTLPWQNIFYNPGSNEADFILAGNGLSLPDGNYIATLSHTKVSDIAGNALAADRIIIFFMLHGDGNGDRKVNALDFNALATHYGTAISGASKGDFNFDGTVDSSDFSILAASFGKVLPSSGDLPVDAALPLAAAGAPPTSLFNSEKQISSDGLLSVLS